MPAADLGVQPRLFYGWTVVATAFLVLFMAYGTQYAFGVFLAALVEEFGWSRVSLSGVFSLYAFVYSVFALGAGRPTDRWGPRAVIATGGALLGIGLILMSRVTALWQPYLLYGTLAALGMSTAYVPCNATVAKWFTRRRGIAVGLASAGGPTGTPPRSSARPSPTSSAASMRRASPGCSSRWPGRWPRAVRSRPASSTIAPATTGSRGGAAPPATGWR
jgi:MFS family permease